jgi:mRNA-degrading endonuclease RelE of RelBE toxin-antitoxin system
MAYDVVLKKAIRKEVQKLPVNVRQRFEALALSLRDSGPTGPHGWPNYGKLGKNEYHCHLNYHYVACWRHEKETITIIEVYYVGSRENAPY